MSSILLFFRRVRGLVQKEKLDREMVEEMQFHLAQRAADQVRDGLPVAAARRAAQRRFGNLALIQERVRDQRGWPAIEHCWRDLRVGARSLAHAPGFTLTAVLTLTLGLTLVATTMAVVNAYLIRSMPYPAADRLHHVLYAPVGQPEPRGVTALDWAALSDVVEVADSSIPARYYFPEESELRPLGGMKVSRGSLEALGIRAAIGHAFSEADFAPGSEPVAMLGHELWRERFGSDPTVVGRQFRVRETQLRADRGESYRIVGVLPPAFHFAREYARGPVEMVVPLKVPMRAYFVRLRAGVPAADAAQRITDVVRNVATSLPPDWRGVRLESLRARYVAELQPVLVALSVAAGLVLLIVGANLAILTLLRALRRQRELAVRVALGAGRGQLARMLLAEAALVCGTAAAASLGLTATMLRAAAPIIGERLGRPVPGGVEALAIDATVLITLGGATLVLVFSLGFVPLLTLGRNLVDAMRRNGAGATDLPSMRRLRTMLIIAEIAASFALLFGGVLMVRSLFNLVHTDLGFSTEQVLRARVALPVQKYPDADSFRPFYDGLMERLAAVRGTEFALTNHIPFYPTPRQKVEIDRGENPGFSVGVLAVSDGYFSTLRIGIKEGRGFLATDRPGSEAVAVVSESLARRLWPQGSVLGRRLRTADQPVGNAPLTEWRTVVGITRDVRQTHTDQDLNDIFVPFRQAPSRYAPLFLRSDRPIGSWVETLRAITAELDSDVQITGLNTLEAEGERLLARPRFLTSVLGVAAGFAALLAFLGIYGVTAYSVQQREREIAIRMALGATGNAVVMSIISRGASILVTGLIVGLFVALAGAQLLASHVHGLPSRDGTTLLLVAAFVTTAGLLATWWPARRAAVVDPMKILKSE